MAELTEEQINELFEKAKKEFKKLNESQQTQVAANQSSFKNWLQKFLKTLVVGSAIYRVVETIWKIFKTWLETKPPF